MLVKINGFSYRLNLNSNTDLAKPTNILQFCETFNIEIPRFCYREGLNVAGNCRMCLVEVEKAPKPLVACATPLLDQMSIYTETPLVKKARENVLELLLINHPLDCPICDQGGECDLQENTKDFASDRNRNFLYHRRRVQDKNTGPIIKTIMTRCIHCTRCVRFSQEIFSEGSLQALGRGTQMEIGTYIEKFINSELSGNLVDICPVGALTSKSTAFTVRSWELKSIRGFDVMDALGSPLIIQTRNVTIPQNFQKKQNNVLERDQIIRILPYSDSVNLEDAWISDKTRYSFDALYKNRLTKLKFVSKSKQNNSIFQTYFFDFFKLLSNFPELKISLTFQKLKKFY